MFDQRLIITANLKLLAPLHVGTGEAADRNDVIGKKDGESKKGNPVEVSAIVRDGRGHPYVPSTTVKGILRSLVENEDDDVCRILFGYIKQDDKNNPGAKGRLTVYGMRFTRPLSATSVEKLPFFEKENFVFVSAHTAIDDKTGAADHHKLYHEERVAPGAIFKLRLAYTPQEGDHEIRRKLWRLLSHLASEHGVAFGAGQADANGRMKLDGTFEITSEEVNAAGDVVLSKMETLPVDFQAALDDPPSVSGDLIKLRLTCDLPFLIADSAYEVNSKLLKTDPRRLQVSALRGSDALPMVNGESIMGAIRTKAEWLEALDREPDEKSENSENSIVAQLFGHTGQRAKLKLVGLTVLKAKRLKTIASVALDRFSGEPIDQALFKSECFIGTEIDLVLQLDAKAEVPAKEFAKLLTGNLCDEGLELGHGAAKGFGWFNIARHKELETV